MCRHIDGASDDGQSECTGVLDDESFVGIACLAPQSVIDVSARKLRVKESLVLERLEDVQ